MDYYGIVNYDIEDFWKEDLRVEDCKWMAVGRMTRIDEFDVADCMVSD